LSAFIIQQAQVTVLGVQLRTQFSVLSSAGIVHCAYFNIKLHYTGLHSRLRMSPTRDRGVVQWHVAGRQSCQGGLPAPESCRGRYPGEWRRGRQTGKTADCRRDWSCQPSSSYKHQDMVSWVYWSIYVDDVASV